MNVIIVLGSVRKGRQSDKIASYLKSKLEEKNISTDLLDLSEDPLPILEDKSGQSLQIEERIGQVSKRLHRADAMIFVSPEYHGSFSGVLKNALDYFWAEFKKKPIGVVTVSAGKLGGINASTQLQHVILSLGAYPLPIKLLVAEVQQAFDESLLPLGTSLARSAEAFVSEFIWFSEAITTKKKEELISII